MTNPNLAGFYPDPSACVVQGRYHLADSSFEYSSGIPLQVCDNFETWTPLGHAVDRPTRVSFNPSRFFGDHVMLDETAGASFALRPSDDYALSITVVAASVEYRGGWRLCRNCAPHPLRKEPWIARADWVVHI